MKQMNKHKALLVTIMIALLLTISVSGTLAWLATSSDPVENVFTPTTADTDIDEDIENNVKTSIVITNYEVEGVDQVPVYVRVAVIGNWCNADGVAVEPWAPSFTPTDKWFTDSDGYYYYEDAVPVGGETTNLLPSSGIPLTVDEAKGLHLEVTVIHQSIQAVPDGAVEAVWPVDADNGTITLK